MLGTPNGIQVLSSGNTIGGSTAAARNVIAGNDGTAISIPGGSTVVQGNYIGTTADGLAALGNLEGVTLVSNGNTIGGPESGRGQRLVGQSDYNRLRSGRFVQQFERRSNVVEGNLIGTDKNGTAAIPNSRRGIYVGTDGGANNIIRGNVVSGNNGDGLDLFGPGVNVRRESDRHE